MYWGWEIRLFTFTSKTEVRTHPLTQPKRDSRARKSHRVTVRWLKNTDEQEQTRTVSCVKH